MSLGPDRPHRDCPPDSMFLLCFLDHHRFRPQMIQKKVDLDAAHHRPLPSPRQSERDVDVGDARRRPRRRDRNWHLDGGRRRLRALSRKPKVPANDVDSRPVADPQVEV